MSYAEYLVDTSALVRLLRDPTVRDRWEQPLVAGLLAVCPLVELEFLYSARSASDRARLTELLRTVFGWVPVSERGYERAAEIQSELTDRGTHRSAGAVDLLIAATAEYHGLSLLHYDRDFDQIANVTGQPMRWLAPVGSIK
ncbi:MULTISPECIES: PIN domain nuclease [unclassified Micromonospora]|uniref:PIN domain nuclease n=1 Tax=unclassified Micromonospora TaxID=2617518 RepID=UPI0022B70084|nr:MULTISPECIES: PIN domain nuclease [unclassified Micromonospora]MCZ7421584.1 PIN domain nuclease [Verrucosispora sp. WMMA2121]WBB93732.1 PIN domain nuclease [Verrucosispora sp. WMMC514]